jgi:transposase InsO family protein
MPIATSRRKRPNKKKRAETIFSPSSPLTHKKHNQFHTFNMNRLLGNIAIEEIRGSMRGLTGKPAKQMAARLAESHRVKPQRIYELTKDLRPARKTRSDKGRRSFDLVEGSDVWYAAQLVVADKLDPDQALLTTKIRRPDAKLPSLEYFRQMLAEKGLGKKQRRLARRAFRSWEAEYPGEIFQVDVTALKVRWQDETTRRILRIEGVDKNHPQMDPTKLRVWQIMLVDDHSRRRFLRYISTTHITSAEMVRFLCEAFQELGVPITLYSDNGSEFKDRHIHAAKILNKVLENDGGYRHLTHKPGNSQASGKVEVAHRWAEKADRFVGLAVTEGQAVTIETLNVFADRAVKNYNTTMHRATKQAPIDRWFSKRVVVRTIDPEIIQDALLSDVFESVLDASMTVSHKGKIYKVPGEQPFVNYIGQKVKIVVPSSIDLILLTLPDGSEFEIQKILAMADKAGEFKSVKESMAQDLTKRLRASRKEEVKAIKAKRRLTGQVAPVPHYNVEIEQPVTNIAHFPHEERVVSYEEVAAVTPLPQTSKGKDIGYWEAVGMFADQFTDIDLAKEFLLTIFPNEQGAIPKGDVQEAIDRRSTKKHGLLKAV